MSQLACAEQSEAIAERTGRSGNHAKSARGSAAYPARSQLARHLPRQLDLFDMVRTGVRSMAATEAAAAIDEAGGDCRAAFFKCAMSRKRDVGYSATWEAKRESRIAVTPPVTRRHSGAAATTMANARRARVMVAGKRAASPAAIDGSAAGMSPTSGQRRAPLDMMATLIGGGLELERVEAQAGTIRMRG